MNSNYNNLIIIYGLPDTGKTSLGVKLNGVLPNSIRISTDTVTQEAIEKGIIPIPSNYAGNYCINIGDITIKLNKAFRKKLFELTISKIYQGLFWNDSVIVCGYLFNFDGKTEIFNRFSNICFIERFSDFKSKISINDITIEVDDVGIDNLVDAVKNAIKNNMIEQIIPQYHWYQNFDFLKTPSDSISKDKLVALMLPEDMHGSTVLDIGCNTGFFSIECAKRGASVVGIDYFGKVIDLANKIKNSIYFVNNIKFYEMNVGENLNELGTFSHILMLSVIHYLDNQEDIIKRILGILKPGGVLKLEMGIHPDKTVDTKIVNEKYYPTESKIKSILTNYTYTINKSVDQGGDDIPRFVVSVIKEESREEWTIRETYLI